MKTSPDSLRLFNITISNLKFEQFCEQINDHIKQGQHGYVLTPNVNHVCLCHRDPHFHEIYQHALHAIPDGTPIMWAASLLGTPLHEKLSGSDMVPKLSAYAAKNDLSVYFLGGSPGTAEQTAKALKIKHPKLTIAGTDCPAYGFEKDPRLLQETIDKVSLAKPHICFIALGSPKQEYFMYQHQNELGAAITIGVGASFDFMAGRIKRAPYWLQSIGLEWFWRLAMEPRRLWKRYLVEDVIFFKLLWNEFKKHKHPNASQSS